MKTYEYAKIHGLISKEDWTNHFRHNLHTGKEPVAMYSCPDCKEIFWNYPDINHKCINGELRGRNINMPS